MQLGKAHAFPDDLDQYGMYSANCSPCSPCCWRAVGLYSVVSYTVAQRTAEFGVRFALGAQAADVVRVVFASTLRSVAGGMVAGSALALALSGIVEKWAGATSRDPFTLISAIVVLSMVAVVACAIPARHAIQADPISALRSSKLVVGE
jgi:ABC-type antimicrobial peptide transport system permease subunit